MTVPIKARIVRVEHVVNLFSEGAAVSLPIVVSDSTCLLRLLLGKLGSEDYSPMQWDLYGRHQPFAAWECVYFNRAAGWRLRQHLHALVGTRWRWRSALRMRAFGTASGSSGRVDVPVERGWMARFPTMPGPAEEEYFRSWGDGREFGLWNDGLIAMDISRVRGIVPDYADLAAAGVVARMLVTPDIWGHIQDREGLFVLRICADVAGLLDDHRTLRVQWKPRKGGGSVAEVTAMPAAGECHAAARTERPMP